VNPQIREKDFKYWVNLMFQPEDVSFLCQSKLGLDLSCYRLQEN